MKKLTVSLKLNKRSILMLLTLGTIIILVALLLAFLCLEDSSGSRKLGENDEYQDTNFIENSCAQKLDKIKMVGDWEYLGNETNYWKLNLQANNQYAYLDKNGLESNGAWEYDDVNKQLKLKIEDEYKYWEENFFILADFAQENIEGIVGIDPDDYTITFHVYEYETDNCTSPFKAINFFGWYFVKNN